MKINFKFFILPIVCITVVGVTFYMIFDIQKKVEDLNYEVGEDLLLYNNDVNIEEEVVVPEESEVVTNNEEEETKAVAPEDDREGTTDRKQEAIELVKERWGPDNTVSFRCDTVTARNEYIIEVVSRSSAEVRNRFKVNLVTREVEIYY